jgi:hypothetical protein
MCRVRLLASKFVQYFQSIEIFIIQIGEMLFCKPEFIIIKSNYFQNAQKSQYILDDFEALMRERRFRALVLQHRPKSIRTSARTSISRPSMRSRNIILQVVSSKKRITSTYLN